MVSLISPGASSVTLEPNLKVKMSKCKCSNNLWLREVKIKQVPPGLMLMTNNQWLRLLMQLKTQRNKGEYLKI